MNDKILLTNSLRSNQSNYITLSIEDAIEQYFGKERISGYEVWHNTPIRPVYDIDAEYETEEERKEDAIPLIKSIFKNIKELYDSDAEIYLFVGFDKTNKKKKPYKNSFHILVNNAGYFEDARDIPLPQCVKEDKKWDLSIYKEPKSQQKFRLPYCYKDDEKRYLRFAVFDDELDELDVYEINEIDKYQMKNFFAQYILFEDKAKTHNHLTKKIIETPKTKPKIRENNLIEVDNTPKKFNGEIDYTKEQIDELFYLLVPNRVQEWNWEFFRNICWCSKVLTEIYKYDLKDVCVDISKMSSKHDDAATEQLFNVEWNKQKYGERYGLGWLINQVKTINPEGYDKWFAENVVSQVRDVDKTEKYLKIEVQYNEIQDEIAKLEVKKNSFEDDEAGLKEKIKINKQIKKLETKQTTKKRLLNIEQTKISNKKKENYLSRKREEKEQFELDDKIQTVIKEALEIKPFDKDDDFTWNDFKVKYCRMKKFKNMYELVNTVLKDLRRVFAHLSVDSGYFVKKINCGNEMFNFCTTNTNLMIDWKVEGFAHSIGPGDLTKSFAEVLGYSQSVCKPAYDQKPNELNVWIDYKAKINDYYHSDDYKLMLNLIKEVICDNDETIYKGILWLIKQWFTNPDPSGLALFIYSPQGVGKDFIFEFLTFYVFGTGLVMNMCGIKEATDEFNIHLQGKKLNIVNEMASTKEQFKSNFDKIKPFITNKMISVQKKKVDRCQIENIGNWVFFTNHKDSLYIEKGDRRYVPLEASAKYKDNRAFFQNIKKKCFNDNTGEDFFKYICELDDNELIDLNTLIDTKLKREIREISETSVESWCRNVMVGEKMKFETTKNLYNKYTMWCESTGEHKYTERKFSLLMKNNYEKKRERIGMGFLVNYDDENE